jgi:2,3-diaminopropionate biosynthesis protein SbnB
VSRLLYLSGRDVATACRDFDPVPVVADALAQHAFGHTVLPEEAYLGWRAATGDPARILAMPGLIDGRQATAGVKLIGSNPGNPANGRARAAGLTVLFDTATAEPVCVMEAAHISALRTAAITALAARLLARPPVERVALIGAGTIGAMHLELLPPALPDLAEMRIHDLDQRRAAVLAAVAGARLEGCGIEVAPAGEAEEAIRGAALVVLATTAGHGYVELSWLAPGALVVNVSLDDVLPEVVLGTDRVIVDDWRLVRADRRRLLGRMAREGLLSGPGEGRGPVHAELGEVLVGRRPGRTAEEERILVNPFGLAIEDVAVARRVHASARGLGLGVSLEA